MKDGCRDTEEQVDPWMTSHSSVLVTPLPLPEAYSLERVIVGFANLWCS